MDDIRTEVISDKYTDEENSDAFSEFQGAILWPRRSLLYRICFLALLPLFAIFLLGFSSPFWMKKHQVDKYRGYYNLVEKVDVSIGLWRVCEGTDFSDITDCTGIPDINSYIMATQAMLCLSFIFTVFSLIFGLYENCATRYDIDEGNEAKTKRPEMNAITAGIFGLIGVGMYGALIIDVTRNGEGGVHWAFAVTAASVTGIIVCGILMAIANPIHSTTQGYPGQIMSLSRQSSGRMREPSIQDRLVVSNETVAQATGGQAAGTIYGVTGANFDPKEVSFLQRSESCLSSHMSSPDIYTAASQETGLPHANVYNHVVETHDIHNSRAGDPARRQALKQQLQNKAAQRRSWHFDDRNGAYVVSELINNRACASLPSEAKAHRETDGVKPPVPPRRDKALPQANATRPSTMTQTLQAIPDETNDLMILDDPVVIAPSKAEQKQNEIIRTDDCVVKRNTNPFIEDNRIPDLPPTHNFADLQRSTVSSGSWESQPWPDPPPESEILAQTAPVVPNNNNNNHNTISTSTTSDVSSTGTSASQTNSVPESLQYQPQNYASLSRKQSRENDSKPAYPSPSTGGTAMPNDPHAKSVRSSHTEHAHRHRKKTANRKTSPPTESQVPIMKEYDNPLFKSQPPDGERQGTFETDFALQICESTSFVHPSPASAPAPPAYYAVVDTMQNDPASYGRHSGHHTYTPDDRENSQQNSRHFAHDAPPAYTRHNKGNKDDASKKHSNSKEKSRSNHKQHQHLNGGVKSRPRQVKREHQQRRSGHPEADNGQQQQPPSPHGSRYGSSPNLASRSPRMGRRAEDVCVYGQGDYYRNTTGRSKTPPQYSSSPYGYESRQSPYYNVQASQHRQWGDSDL